MIIGRQDKSLDKKIQAEATWKHFAENAVRLYGPSMQARDTLRSTHNTRQNEIYSSQYFATFQHCSISNQPFYILLRETCLLKQFITLFENKNNGTESLMCRNRNLPKAHASCQMGPVSHMLRCVAKARPHKLHFQNVQRHFSSFLWARSNATFWRVAEAWLHKLHMN